MLIAAAPAFGGPGNSGTPIPLAPLPGDTDSFATAINNRGDVAGRSVGAVTTAMLWDKKGNATALLPLPGDASSFGEGINNRGQVIGRSRSGAGPCAAFGVDTAVIWDRHGTPTALAPLPGDAETRGFGINNNGVAVGISLSPRRPDCTASFTAVRWDRRGNPTVLPSPSAALPEGFANGIASNGRASGFINDAVGSAFSAATWDQHDVPTIPQGTSAIGIYITTGINERGTTVGESFDPFFQVTAPVWDASGNLTGFLPPAGADPEAMATGINGSGAAVGSSGALLFGLIFGLFDPPGTAVVWDNNGVPSILAPLPGDLFSYGFGINDGGDAVGHSLSAGGVHTAVVWR